MTVILAVVALGVLAAFMAVTHPSCCPESKDQRAATQTVIDRATGPIPVVVPSRSAYHS